MESGVLVNGAPPAYPLGAGVSYLGQSRPSSALTMITSTPSSQAIKTPSSVAGWPSVQLSFHNPDVNLELPTVDFRFAPEDGQIIAKAALDPHAVLCIRVAGKIVAGGTEFKPEQVSLGVDGSGDDARTHFVASTLTALLALSQVGLRMPEIGLAYENLSLDLSLKQIGEELATRQTAYRLMVIGRATGNCLDFPPKLTREQVGTITFLYRAIADRTFDWPLTKYILPVFATAEEAQRWRGRSQTAPITVVEQDLSLTLLGHLVHIGTVKVIFKKAIIKDLDAFVEELAAADGHEVRTSVTAVDGRAGIECPDAPNLLPNSWTPQEQALIELWPALCDRLADRYHALAAATLAGLTEEEKAEITARPELDEDAHLMGDEDSGPLCRLPRLC